MLELDDEAARADLLVGERLVREVDRSGGNALGDERFDPLLGIPPAQNGLDLVHELGAVQVAVGVRHEARILHERALDAEDRAEAPPQTLVAHRDDHEPVARAHRLIGRHGRVRVPEALGPLARREVAPCEIGEPRRLRLEQGDVEELPAAGPG